MSYNNKIVVVQNMCCCYLAIIISCLVAEAGAFGYLHHICLNTTTHTPNSIFQANLKKLRTIMSRRASRNVTQNPGYYNNDTVGNSPENMAYGVSFCQVDLTDRSCQECVTEANGDIATMCRSYENLQVIWYEGCMVRYGSKPFYSSFTKEDERLSFSMWNTQNVTDEAEFQKVFNSTMTELTNRASEGKHSNNRVIKGFAFGSKDITSVKVQTLYALVQCIPAFPPADCDRCLGVAINIMQKRNNSQGARGLVGHCMARYELYPFYNTDTSTSPTDVGYYNESKRFDASVLAIVLPSSAVLVVLIALAYWLIKKKKIGIGRRKQKQWISSNIDIFGSSEQGSPKAEEVNDIDTGTNDVKLYSLRTIIAATENFSSAHKIGEGGFGSVYKGTLHDGQDIAVKRLSNTSRQGIDEFKNEVTLIAKLQHRNLVRLVGYCNEKEEKMLIYEYLPNKGLDCFLFDNEKKYKLDWEKRFDIALGIARGMVYLHHDSRLRIIHRDLKASNILLDGHLNPKISDFGMARIFGNDQIEEMTRRVVGTIGYMAPEYAMEGLYSIKSDVFSFGVLLLEIITGRKNSSHHTKISGSLVGHVWDLWRESRVLDIVDQSLGESHKQDTNILRCIHIGLLCVQESADARPSMSEVVYMLCNETRLPPPGQAWFVIKTSNPGPTSTISSSVGAKSVNEVTISMVESR